MAELDEQVKAMEVALTCSTPFGFPPLPLWFVNTARQVIKRDGERGERIRGLEAENAELREQLQALALKACTSRHRAEHCPLLGRVDELRAENVELREQLEGMKRRNKADGALIDCLRRDIQKLWHEHKGVVAYKGCTCPECNGVRETLERLPRLQERLDRLEGRLRGRFHDEMMCGACGGPLDACRDAICCQCSPEPEVLAEVSDLRRWNAKIAKLLDACVKELAAYHDREWREEHEGIQAHSWAEAPDAGCVACQIILKVQAVESQWHKSKHWTRPPEGGTTNGGGMTNGATG